MGRRQFGLAELGRRIAAARLRAKLTQGDLGKRLRVDPMTVSRWERGERGIDALGIRAIAKACRTDVRRLLGLL